MKASNNYICLCTDCGLPIYHEKDIAYTFNDGYEAVCNSCEDSDD